MTASLGTQVLARPRKLALLFGLIAATGFEPLHAWPLALLALAGLIELIARAPDRRTAALSGWLFGLGHFTLGNNWIATAFTYQSAMPAWLGWIAVVGLAAFLAVYPAMAALAAWQLGRTSRPALILAFAGFWGLAEWLRGWVFTGFPWNPLAAIALGPFERPGLASTLPWLGTHALSALVVVLAGCLWLALRRGRTDWRGAVLALAGPALMLLPNWWSTPHRQGAAFTLIQPNIAQETLNAPEHFEDNVDRLVALSAPGPLARRRLVLWPESGVPYYLLEGYPAVYYADTFGGDPRLARRRLGAAMGRGDLLMSGTVDLVFSGRDPVGAYNSVTALDAAGTIRGRYAKAHLVPGGEYLPLRALLTPLGLARLVPGDIDFWPGPGPRTLDLGDLGRAGIQVCYEIIFPGHVVDRAHRPDFIFNPSNDGWFGAWGPPQHLAQARLRAIEEGLPVLRSTTTGISAVIDARGVVRQSVPHGAMGRLDGRIPASLAPTPFARLGNLLSLIWIAALLVASLVASRRRAE